MEQKQAIVEEFERTMQQFITYHQHTDLEIQNMVQHLDESMNTYKEQFSEENLKRKLKLYNDNYRHLEPNDKENVLETKSACNVARRIREAIRLSREMYNINEIQNTSTDDNAARLNAPAITVTPRPIQKEVILENMKKIDVRKAIKSGYRNPRNYKPKNKLVVVKRSSDTNDKK